MAKEKLFAVIDMALAVVKDAALADCIKRVENAQREYLLAEADKNRAESKAVIQSIAKIDIECRKMEITYDKVKDELGNSGEVIMEELIDMLSKERKRLVKEKNLIMKRNT